MAWCISWAVFNDTFFVNLSSNSCRNKSQSVLLLNKDIDSSLMTNCEDKVVITGLWSDDKSSFSPLLGGRQVCFWNIESNQVRDFIRVWRPICWSASWLVVEIVSVYTFCELTTYSMKLFFRTPCKRVYTFQIWTLGCIRILNVYLFRELCHVIWPPCITVHMNNILYIKWV